MPASGVSWRAATSNATHAPQRILTTLHRLRNVAASMNNQCAMTGQVVESSGDGVWDDGEWISWDWINTQIDKQELKQRFPNVNPELFRVFQNLVDTARDYKETTGRYLPVFGELGELFGELHFGITRHKPGTPGSDGRLGNDFIEIKTITPEKKAQEVAVKRKGNFNKLLVVKISDEFEFEARMLERKKMGKGPGKLVRVAWSSMTRHAL